MIVITFVSCIVQGKVYMVFIGMTKENDYDNWMKLSTVRNAWHA